MIEPHMKRSRKNGSLQSVKEPGQQTVIGFFVYM